LVISLKFDTFNKLSLHIATTIMNSFAQQTHHVHTLQQVRSAKLSSCSEQHSSCSVLWLRLRFKGG
jgi:hypothetical protein